MQFFFNTRKNMWILKESNFLNGVQPHGKFHFRSLPCECVGSNVAQNWGGGGKQIGLYLIFLHGSVANNTVQLFRGTYRIRKRN